MFVDHTVPSLIRPTVKSRIFFISS